MKQVDIYTQSHCPYCERALRLLRSKDVRINEIDAPRGTEARETARARSGGRSSVPQIFIGDRHLGGCDDLLALDRSGELAAMLTD